MIKDFGVITRTGEIFHTTLSIRSNMYNNARDLVSLEFFNTKGNGICWIYNEELIKIYPPPEGFITAYPSVDMSCVLAVYGPYTNKAFPAPGNAVVYNSDGSIKRILTPPRLISRNASGSSTGFDSAIWAKDSKSNTVLTVSVGFASDWYEERVVNPHTGEFGECLGASRL